MGFGLSNLFSYHTKKEAYDTSSVSEADSTGSKETEHVLSARELASFTKGSSVTGQVVGMEGDMVKLKLADDTYVNARLEKEMHVLVGQRLTFEVKSSSGNALSLIPLFTNLNTGTNVIKGLEAANIPVNDGSVSMVTAMMDKGMSIDVSSLQNMYRQIMSYPQADPADLVEMRQLSIPITKENLVQFEAYKNYEHQILSGIREIAEGLEQTALDLIRSGDGQGAAAIYKELTAMLSEGEILPGQAEAASNDGLGTEMISLEGSPQAQQLPSEETAEAILLKGQEIQADAKMPAEGVLPTEPEGIVKSPVRIVTEEIVKSPVKTVAEEIVKSPVRIVAEDMPLTFEENELAITNERPEQEWELSGLLKGQERAVLSEHLTELGVPERITQAVREGTISYKQLFSVLSKVSEGKHKGEPLEKLYSSKEFGTLIKDRMMKQLLLEPETVGKEGKVSEYYEKLREQTQRLTDTLSAIGKEDSNLFKSVDNLRQNMDFMNQINQAFTYVQLPLKFSQGSGHGDLYVYTNKKNLAKDDGSISALLHLDMENLGPVDVYVAMTGSERVSTKFYLKDDDMLSFIESNIHILNERLEKRGYLLKTEVTVKSNEEKDFAKRLSGGGEEEKHMLLSTQAFDVRA